MVLLLFAICLITIVCYLLLKSKYEYWAKRKVPFPPPYLLFGNIGEAIFLQKPLHQLCTDVYNEYKDYAYVGFYNMWSPAIVVRDIELIKKILIQNFDNFQDNFISVPKDVDPILAVNLVCLKGHEWKATRILLTSQFTSAKLKYSIPIIEKVSQDFIKYINQRITTSKSCCLDAQELSARFTGESVLMSAFGLEGDSFQSEVPITFRIGEEISGSGIQVKIKQVIGTFFPLLSKMLKLTFIGSPIPNHFRDIIMENIKHRTLKKVDRPDYLDYLWKLRTTTAGVTDDDIVGYAFTYFLEGFETAGLVLTYILYELALNPEVQEECKCEVKKILKKHNNELTSEALSELEYLTRVIFETLRLHAPLVISTRICTRDFKVPNPANYNGGNDVVIEKGTFVFIPVQSIHEDDLYYRDPHVFDPDRFTDEHKNQRPSGCYFGFGDGPRICLGRNYAMLQLKISLVAILNEFVIKRNVKTTVPYEQEFLHFLNVPKGGVFLDFVK